MIRLLNSSELPNAVHRCTWHDVLVAKHALEWSDIVTGFKKIFCWTCIRSLSQDVFETAGTNGWWCEEAHLHPGAN